MIKLANSDETIHVPTRLAYQGGGYEVINSVLKPGGGEQLVDTGVKLLRASKRQ